MKKRLHGLWSYICTIYVTSNHSHEYLSVCVVRTESPKRQKKEIILDRKIKGKKILGAHANYFNFLFPPLVGSKWPADWLTDCLTNTEILKAFAVTCMCKYNWIVADHHKSYHSLYVFKRNWRIEKFNIFYLKIFYVCVCGFLCNNGMEIIFYILITVYEFTFSNIRGESPVKNLNYEIQILKWCYDKYK